MTRWSILTCAIFALPACDALFQINTVKADDANGDGGTRDSGSGTPDAADCTLVGKNGGSPAAPRGMLQVCVPNALDSTHELGETLETDADCDDVGSGSVCIRWLPDNSEIGTVIVTGSRPLVLASRTSIAIAGRLDVQNAGQSGSNCSLTFGQSSPAGGGGGGGGGFQKAGGPGGDGAPSTGGERGAGQVQPTSLEFACPGGAGGEGSTSSGVASGGAEGGVVYLVAGAQISVKDTGLIDVSGFGGGAGGEAGAMGGGSGGGGGGGGGAGGLIVFDAPAITTSPNGGMIVANGGGGGGGGGASPGLAGTRSSGLTTQAGIGGNGANGAGSGGNGGDGTHDGAGGGAATNGGGGGGGGGGAGGWILYYSQQAYPAALGAHTSPPARPGT